MNRFLLWFFSKPRFTHADVIILCTALIVNGWKGLIILFVGIVICALIGYIAEWRNDITKGGH